jgi:LacI family transcriptional regulator
MKFEATTIKDIAKALQISTSTVSRALKDSHEISRETKDKVKACAAAMHYKPNPMAVGLKSRKTRSIGIIVSEIANPFFSQVIDGIESIAHHKGYHILIAQTRESYERELADLHFLASRSIDGLLVSVSLETKDFSHFRQFQNQGLPTVFFDRTSGEMDSHTVILDNFKGTYDATCHLLDQGYQKIAVVCSSPFLSTTTERLSGYHKAIQDKGKCNLTEYHLYCTNAGKEVEDAETGLEKMLALPSPPDAILCLSDKLTTICLSVLKTKGIKIPEQMGLAGFLNNELAALMDPPLTVIKQPAFEMGKVATELLLQLIESKRPVLEFEKRKLLPQLVVRVSSKKPA